MMAISKYSKLDNRVHFLLNFLFIFSDILGMQIHLKIVSFSRWLPIAPWKGTLVPLLLSESTKTRAGSQGWWELGTREGRKVPSSGVHVQSAVLGVLHL